MELTFSGFLIISCPLKKDMKARKNLKNIKIYARMASKQKKQVINVIKNQGYVTLMCDDETNDVDALKHSHVGVALLSHSFDVTKAKMEKSQL
uniref:Probable cation-transporting ATPase (inferred by orthology to a C. elegans protein) n=1 Tax=Strongyloides venezuelensis TaxID=75913 RepID=A0A0K0FI81_STRVS